jgi:hypothetical protein
MKEMGLWIAVIVAAAAAVALGYRRSMHGGTHGRSSRNLAARLSLLAIAAGFGAVVIYKAALCLPGTGGPFLAPLHAEDWLALAVTVSLIFNSLRATAEPGIRGEDLPSGRALFWPITLIATLTFLLYWRALRYPLLADDYLIVRYQQNWSWAGIVQQFRVPGGDGFFRPITNLTLSATALWAGPGNRPELWRLIAFSLHCVNAILVYLFASQLKLARTAAVAAACIFAVHATHPEAVAWIAGRFDLVSTLFVLLALVLFKAAYASKRFNLLVGLAALSMILGALSKECGFIFPVLATLVALHAGEKSRRVALALGLFYAGAAALFAYRWSLLGGVGGYLDASGRPQALHFSLGRAFNTLFLRLWTALYFPINWSVQPGALLVFLLAVYIGALLWLMLGQPSLRDISLCIGLVLATALVPLHLLLVDKDLQGARMIYLASAMFSILLGAALTGLPPKARSFCAVVIILFNYAALTHNLNIWEGVSQHAQQACQDASRYAGASANRLLVQQLPESLDGVFFFGNGFPECVEATAGRKIEVEIDRGSAPHSSNGQAVLRWNQQQQQLECSGGGCR